jgi:hypothetical protein
MQVTDLFGIHTCPTFENVVIFVYRSGTVALSKCGDPIVKQCPDIVPPQGQYASFLILVCSTKFLLTYYLALWFGVLLKILHHQQLQHLATYTCFYNLLLTKLNINYL